MHEKEIEDLRAAVRYLYLAGEMHQAILEKIVGNAPEDLRAEADSDLRDSQDVLITAYRLLSGTDGAANTREDSDGKN